MAHTAETYRKIHQLLSQNIPYRQIADDLKINKNTVQSVFHLGFSFRFFYQHFRVIAANSH